MPPPPWIDLYVLVKIYHRRNVPWCTPTSERFVRTKKLKYIKYEINPDKYNFVMRKITSFKISFEKNEVSTKIMLKLKNFSTF